MKTQMNDFLDLVFRLILFQFPMCQCGHINDWRIELNTFTILYSFPVSNKILLPGKIVPMSKKFAFYQF